MLVCQMDGTGGMCICGRQFNKLVFLHVPKIQLAIIYQTGGDNDLHASVQLNKNLFSEFAGTIKTAGISYLRT